MFRDYFSQKLKEDEDVLMIIRKHWASFLKQIIILALILVVPFFFIIFFFSRWYTLIIFFIWISIGVGYGVFQWFTWYFDSLIVTNKRVINVDQKSLFRRMVSEAEIGNIQDINYEIDGFFASVFGFGTLVITTGGSENAIRIKNVDNPSEIQEALIEKRNELREESMSAEDLIELLQKDKDEKET